MIVENQMRVKKCLFILILGLWPDFVWADRVASYSKVTCIPELEHFSFEYAFKTGYMEYAWDMEEKLELWEKYSLVEDTSDFSDPEGEIEIDLTKTRIGWQGEYHYVAVPLLQQKHVFTKYCPIGDGVTFRIKSYSMENGSGHESYGEQIEIQYGDNILYNDHEFYRRLRFHPLLSAQIHGSNPSELELVIGFFSMYDGDYRVELKLQCEINDEILSSDLLPFNLTHILEKLDRDHKNEPSPRNYNINIQGAHPMFMVMRDRRKMVNRSP